MFAALSREWRTRGFAPSAIVIDAGPRWWRRALSRLRVRADDSARICRRLRWPFVNVTGINEPVAIAVVKGLRPDVAINAGAGILRKPILETPRIGTIGAHMGLLPAYRGMNVAEWAALNGDAAGCSVFWIDEGIDTGGIIATRPVDVSGCRSIKELRSRVNDAQIGLLAETAMAVIADGPKDPARRQFASEGRQYYRMHADVRRVLEDRLAAK